MENYEENDDYLNRFGKYHLKTMEAEIALMTEAKQVFQDIVLMKERRRDGILDLEQSMADIAPGRFGDVYEPLGEEVSETLHHDGSRILTVNYHKKRYRNRVTGVVHTGPEPFQVFQDLRVDEGMAAHLVVLTVLKSLSIPKASKHLEKQGIRLDEDRIYRILRRANMFLHGQDREYMKKTGENGALCVSDAAIPVFDNEKGKGKPIGYYKVYSHEPTRSVFFCFHEGGKSISPDWTIPGFKGVMQASVWDEGMHFNKMTGIRRAGSMAYLRGRLKSLKDAGIPGTEKPQTTLDSLKSLEDGFRSRGMDHASRRDARAQHVLPLLEELHNTLLGMQSTENIHPRLGAWVNETLDAWENYALHAGTGDMEADLPAHDHGIPLLGLPPRTFLSASTPEAAYRTGVLYGLTATFLWRGEDPQLRMTEILKGFE